MNPSPPVLAVTVLAYDADGCPSYYPVARRASTHRGSTFAGGPGRGATITKARYAGGQSLRSGWYDNVACTYDEATLVHLVPSDPGTAAGRQSSSPASQSQAQRHGRRQPSPVSRRRHRGLPGSLTGRKQLIRVGLRRATRFRRAGGRYRVFGLTRWGLLVRFPMNAGNGRCRRHSARTGRARFITLTKGQTRR